MLRRPNLWGLAPILGATAIMAVLALLDPSPLKLVLAYGSAAAALVPVSIAVARTFTIRVVQRAVTRDIEAYTLPWNYAFRGLAVSVFNPVSYALARVAVGYQTEEFPAALRLMRSTRFGKAFGYSGAMVLLRLRMAQGWSVSSETWEPMRPQVETVAKLAAAYSPEYVTQYLSLPLNGVDEAIEFMTAGIPPEYAVAATSRVVSP